MHLRFPLLVSIILWKIFPMYYNKDFMRDYVVDIMRLIYLSSIFAIGVIIFCLIIVTVPLFFYLRVFNKNERSILSSLPIYISNDLLY